MGLEHYRGMLWLSRCCPQTRRLSPEEFQADVSARPGLGTKRGLGSSLGPCPHEQVGAQLGAGSLEPEVSRASICPGLPGSWPRATQWTLCLQV